MRNANTTYSSYTRIYRPTYKLPNACGNGDKNWEKHTLQVVFSLSSGLVLWSKQIALLY